MTNYKSWRIIDGKARLAIVDENDNIVNRNPIKKELKGLDIEKYKKEIYTNKNLLGYLRRFYEENGRVPEIKDFTNNSAYPGKSIYFLRFGNWLKALDMAGLQKIYAKIYTDKDLLDYLILYVKEYGIIPTKEDFNNNPGYPSTPTYQMRFGSWSNALKLVELDVDSMVKKGVLNTCQQKARLAEIKVINHFKEHPVDLSGENQNSSCDGICPNGKTYDVKSPGLHIGGYYLFGTCNKYRDQIDIYYLLGFNEDYTKLKHGWRIPGKITEKEHFYIGLNRNSRSKFNLKNMKKYDIIDKIKDIMEKE